jgi:Endodeoxyribonuclease RusA
VGLPASGMELVLHHPEPIEGRVRVNIPARAPDHRRRDVDGLAKGLLDLLVAHQVIVDDSLVASLSSKWDSAVPPGRVRVEAKQKGAPRGRLVSDRPFYRTPRDPALRIRRLANILNTGHLHIHRACVRLAHRASLGRERRRRRRRLRIRLVTWRPIAALWLK